MPGKACGCESENDDRGAEAIVLASCISKGNPVGMPCPNFSEMREAIRKKVGENILIIGWTH